MIKDQFIVEIIKPNIQDQKFIHTKKAMIKKKKARGTNKQINVR